MKAREQEFSGSYHPADVTFLLKPVTMPFIDVTQKEREIQSGRKHYSEMLAPERPPAAEYMAVFREAFATNRARVGRDVAALAKAIAARPGPETVLISLARAGTPIGVLLNRTLLRLGRQVKHYSISIIRDRGLDLVAMQTILARHPAADLVFVDGWTGKGAIGRELAHSLANHLPQLRDAPLCVLSDLAGVADLAASDEDYVVPSAILNGVISGLVSRTILSTDLISDDDYHGCVILSDLTGEDLSRWYIDQQMVDIIAALDAATAAEWSDAQRQQAAITSRSFVSEMLRRTGIEDINRVKPGIGEATRALLRRVPERLFVRQPQEQEVKHLMTLAAQKGIVAEIDPALPYRACAIIKTMGNG